MRHLLFVVVVIVCLGISTSLVAQKQCDSALVVSTYKRFAESSSDARLAVAVSESEYDQIKKKDGASGSIFGVEIGVTFEDYHARSIVKASKYSESLSRNQVENVLWTQLDPSTPSVYSECLAAWVRTQRGVHITVKAATETEVTVEASWTPISQDPTMIVPEWRGNLTPTANAEFPATLTAGSAAFILDRPTVERTLVVNYLGFTDFLTIVPFPKLSLITSYSEQVDAASITLGGYMKYDNSQNLIVSAEPGGGPSENFSIAFNAPRAGDYSLEALWTSGSPTEVHVYTHPLSKSCANPNLNMDDADLHYFPTSRGGWMTGTLPSRPDFLGSVLLPKGLSTVTFTSRSCGHGMGGGRLPSTRWVRFTELE